MQDAPREDLLKGSEGLKADDNQNVDTYRLLHAYIQKMGRKFCDVPWRRAPPTFVMFGSGRLRCRPGVKIYSRCPQG